MCAPACVQACTRRAVYAHTSTDIRPNDGAGKLFDVVKTMVVVARATCVGVTLSQHSLFLSVGGEAKSCDESLTTKQTDLER